MTRPARTFRVQLVSTHVVEIKLRAADALAARDMAETLLHDQVECAHTSGFEILHDAVQATNIEELLI